MNDPDVYKVKSIINSQVSCCQQKFKYLVKWKDWPHEYNTQEPVEHLEGPEKAMWTFHEKYPGKPHPAGYVHRLSSLQELA